MNWNEISAECNSVMQAIACIDRDDPDLWAASALLGRRSPDDLIAAVARLRRAGEFELADRVRAITKAI